jgi:AMP nucleosidase
VVDLHDPRLGAAVDETRWDLRRKKLAPERMALSMDRLQHYTRTSPELFQRYVLLTNYSWHVEEFRAAAGDCVGPDSADRQMPASNAKTLTDHLAVLRPDLMLMIGHCAGLRNYQAIGDLVLATAYMRDDRVLDDILPISVPVVSNHTLNSLLLDELTALGLNSRMGIVFTTANRNWELNLAMVEEQLRVSRALAVDMESATVAANGFRYRIPTATLLAVSDKPLHARPKLASDAQNFYTASRRQHVEIAISVARMVSRLYPDGLPTAGLRSPDEPLLGLASPEAGLALRLSTQYAYAASWATRREGARASSRFLLGKPGEALVGDRAPAAVDGEAVATVGELGQLGEGRRADVLPERGLRDGFGRGLVLAPSDQQQRPPDRGTGVDLGR